MSSARGGGRAKPVTDSNHVGYGAPNQFSTMGPNQVMPGMMQHQMNHQPTYTTPHVPEFPQHPTMTLSDNAQVTQLAPNSFRVDATGGAPSGQAFMQNMSEMPPNVMPYYPTQAHFTPQHQGGPSGYYAHQQQYRPNYDRSYIPMVPNLYSGPPMPPTQNAGGSQIQQDSQAKSHEQRQRKILSIVDPDTKNEIVISGEKSAEKVDKPEAVADKPSASPSSASDADLKKVQMKREMVQKFQATMSLKDETNHDATVTVLPKEKDTSVAAEMVDPTESVVVTSTEEVSSSPIKTDEENLVDVDTTPEHPVPASVESEVTVCEVVEDDIEERGTSEKPDGSTVDGEGEDDPENASSPDSEEDEQNQAEAEAERLLERERHLDALHASLLANIEEVDVSKYFYNRAFLYCVRDIEKEFKRTESPVTQKQLEDFGIDITSMPKNMDGKTKRADFTPGWVRNPGGSGNRQGRAGAYPGRSSQDHHRGGGGSRGGGGRTGGKPYTSRVSIDRPSAATKVSLGHLSENAWKPEKISPEDLEKEEIRVKLLLKQVRSLMNKITPTTKEELLREFLDYNVSAPPAGSSDDQLKQVIDIIFDKAVEEPKFCPLYSELCKRQVDAELKINQKLSLFRNALLNRAQQTFVNKTQEDDRVAKMKIIEDEPDPKKKLQLQSELLESDNKFRRRKFGNITFIGQLYRQHLLSTKIVNWCMYDLLNHTHKVEGRLPDPPYDEESLQCAAQMLEALGKQLETASDFQGKTYLDQTLEHMKEIAPLCSNKIRFMIVGVAELRSRGWVPRKVTDQGPKKIAEIHNEIKQEQINNLQQRESYEKRQGIRTGGNSQQLRRAPAPARNSLDNRYTGQSGGAKSNRMASAAANSKLTTSTAPPRTMSLSMANAAPSTQKKNWRSGAGGGGTANESAAPKNAWGAGGRNGSREGSEPRKHSVDERAAAIALAAAQRSGRNIADQRSSSQHSVVSQDDDKMSPEMEEIRKVLVEKQAKMANMVKSDIGEVKGGELSMEEMVKGLFDCIGMEKYGSPNVADVFHRFMQASVEKGVQDDLLPTMGHVLCLALQNKKHKADALKGIAQYCAEVVDYETWTDYPKAWKNIAEVLINSVLYENSAFEGTRPDLNDYRDAFLESCKDPRTDFPYQLLVLSLRRMVELYSTLCPDDHANTSSFVYASLDFTPKLDATRLDDALKSCRPDVAGYESLHAVLHHD